MNSANTEIRACRHCNEDKNSEGPEICELRKEVVKTKRKEVLKVFVDAMVSDSTEDDKALRIKRWLATARCRLDQEDYTLFRNELPHLRRNTAAEAEPVLEKLGELLSRAEFPEGKQEKLEFLIGFADGLPQHLRQRWIDLHAPEEPEVEAEEPKDAGVSFACEPCMASMLAPLLRRQLRIRIRFSAIVPQSADTMKGMAVGLDLPRRFKGSDFDQEVCRLACHTLANSIAQGNHHHTDGLMTALRLMMPAQSGSERAFARPRDDFILRPEVLQWSKQDFLGGLEDNMRIVQRCEAEFAKLMTSAQEGFRAPEILAAGLDLAVVYLKNYSLDKADALYSAMESQCMSRGLPWDVKFMQDLATLRCKQNRQQEAAELLERTPPHEATLRNLGTVYNMLREHDKDLWNLGIVEMHKKNFDEAAPLLERALAAFQADDPEDDVTIAKLRDSVGMCYDGMGRYDDAIFHLAEARSLYERSIGTESPLYGTACERLARALVHAGRHQEGFEAALEAFMVIALQDAVHPTPLFELLGLMLEEIPLESENMSRLAKLQVPIAAAVRNLHFREMDRDGNAGVLYERMSRALVLSSPATGDLAERQAATHRRAMARALLTQAAPLVADATKQGLADLSHISMLIDMQLQTLDTHDAEQRRSLGGNSVEPIGLLERSAVFCKRLAPDDPSREGCSRRRISESFEVSVDAPGAQERHQPKLCVICHFDADRPEVSALCGHFACQVCWSKWLMEKLECPICRCKVRRQNLIQLKGWEDC
eukprot:symbB.v1.2.031142.t2/scaffold3583.1/size55484/1